MATDKQSTSELDDLAFRIYAERVSSGRGGEHIAVDAYRKAADFVAVRDKMRAGELNPQKPVGPQLADCSSPNLPKSHPYNLVSQRFGSLERVAKVKAWLDKNPTPESDPSELIPRLSAAFPDLAWDLPTINAARQIFPAYVGAN